MTESRNPLSRRSLFKTVIVGAVGAEAIGCKHAEKAAPTATSSAPKAASALPPEPPAPKRAGPAVHGESFVHGHQKRDGSAFAKGEPKETCDVVIIGGGPSGLCAAHLLRKRDVILLEKEAQLGGNCSSDEWRGIRFSTGAAFLSEGETEIIALMKEAGAKLLPIAGRDALIVKGEPYFDYFGEGARKLPFAERVRDDFARSAELAKVFAKKHTEAELDRLPFSDFLRDFSPELRMFWDRFGPSNWGASSEHTSARLGISAYSWGGGEEKRLTFPGGLGVGARAIGDYLSARMPGRLRTGTFVHHVELESGRPGSVLVHSLRDGEPHTLRARAVIMAVPKFFAGRIVSDLDAEQRNAMMAFRYAPYPVFNVCLEREAPQPAYDNWFLDAPFADFIPADWVLNQGKSPADAPGVLTVYHPLAEADRSALLDEARLVTMSHAVVDHLERHFPGVAKQVAEVRVYRRGHAMPLPSPGQAERAVVASRARGRILFAHNDSRGDVSSFYGGFQAARDAVAALKKLG